MSSIDMLLHWNSLFSYLLYIIVCPDVNQLQHYCCCCCCYIPFTIVTALDAVDKCCLLSFCEVHSDFETLELAEVGAFVNGVALNNLYCFYSIHKEQ